MGASQEECKEEKEEIHIEDFDWSNKIFKFEINEKGLFNLENYKNIVSFDDKKIYYDDLPEFYKNLSSFVFWRNQQDEEEYSIFSSLAGALIFLKLSDEKQVIKMFLLITIFILNSNKIGE